MSMLPLQQDPSLIWGVLSFVGPDDTESTFEIAAIAEGTTFGDPVPVIETLPSLLIDGALAATTRWENREVVLHLRVSANDGESLAEAEAALFQQRLMDQPPPLVWTSPVGNSAPVVFDVVAADMRRESGSGWDLKEKLHGYRYYTLTLICLPFARAMESTVVPAVAAPPAVPTTVLIDDCTSLTGWTADASNLLSGPTIVSGAVVVEGQIHNNGDFLKLVRTGAVAMGATPYLVVDVELAGHPAFGGGWRIDVDGDTHSPVTVVYTGEVTWQVYFDLTGESFTTLKIYYDYGDGEFIEETLSVANVARTDLLDIAGTPRQQSRTVEVLGSAPTQAAIRLYDATPADLGTDILVYTSRSQFNPSLRSWIDTSSADVSEAATVSGFYNPMDTPMVLLIPANLLTAGTHALLARIVCITAGTLSWQARMTTLGGAALVGSDVVISGEVEIPVTGVGVFEVMNLAAMVLPVVEVEGIGYAVELTLTGTADMGLDDAWLFNLDEGALTWVRDEEGLDWIEIRSPELGAARPSVWGGRNLVGTGASCIDWKCAGPDYGSFGPHRFEPGTMPIFTLCTSSLVSQCEIEYFPRGGWHIRGSDTS